MNTHITHNTQPGLLVSHFRGQRYYGLYDIKTVHNYGVYAHRMEELFGHGPQIIRNLQHIEEAELLAYMASCRHQQGKKRAIRAELTGRTAGQTVDIGTPAPATQAHAQFEAEEAAQRQEEYRSRRIEWDEFAYDDGQVKGVSLRAMVDAGLYTEMRNAVARLRSEVDNKSYAVVAAQESAANGVREKDYIFTDLMEAQLFAATTNTPVGREIARVIIAHHNAYQKQQAPQPASLEDMVKAMLAGISALTANAQGMQGQVTGATQKADEAYERAEQVAASVEGVHQRRPGEEGGEFIAQQLGWYSKAGGLHTLAVSQVANGLVMLGKLAGDAVRTVKIQLAHGPVDLQYYRAADVLPHLRALDLNLPQFSIRVLPESRARATSTRGQHEQLYHDRAGRITRP